MIASRSSKPPWRHPLWWAMVLGGVAVLTVCKGLGFTGGWWFW